MTVFAQIADEIEHIPSTDAPGWIDERLNEHLWSKQLEIVESVQANRRTAVQSCNGVGKSFSAARVVCWWVDTQEDSMVITTAPTGDQVKAILWREIKAAHTKGNLAGQCNVTSWTIDGHLVAFGRKTADTNEHSFQGVHAKKLLVVADEASGLTGPLWSGITKLATGKDNRVLALGNPDVQGSLWHKVCKSDRWNVIHIDMLDSPNFTDEHVPAEVSAQLADRDFVDDVISEYGQDSAAYLKMVRGMFPADSTDSIVSRLALHDCRQVEAVDGQRRVGVDVGAGGDRMVITLVVGNEFVRSVSYIETVPELASARAVEEIRSMEPEVVNVDSIGVGWGLTGNLRQALPTTVVNGITVSEASSNPKRWRILKDEMWWHIRKQAEDRKLAVANMPDSCFEELVSVRWSTDTKNRIVVESKTDLRKRIGMSPDEADSYILAVWPGASSPPGYTAADDWLASAGMAASGEQWDPWA